MTPHQAHAPYDWSALLRLIQTEFAAMDGRIDPPSSMHHLTVEAIAEQARTGEIWVMGAPPLACMFLTPKATVLYLGKLAVASQHRGQGLSRALIEKAATRARALGLGAVEVQVRIELMENHALFRAMGFVEIGRSSHAGFDRPTTVIFHRKV